MQTQPKQSPEAPLSFGVVRTRQLQAKTKCGGVSKTAASFTPYRNDKDAKARQELSDFYLSQKKKKGLTGGFPEQRTER